MSRVPAEAIEALFAVRAAVRISAQHVAVVAPEPPEEISRRPLVVRAEGPIKSGRSALDARIAGGKRSRGERR